MLHPAFWLPRLYRDYPRIALGRKSRSRCQGAAVSLQEMISDGLRSYSESEAAIAMPGPQSRKTARIFLVVFPTVIYGGISLLTFLIDRTAGYLDNPIRQNLFRAGHASLFAGAIVLAAGLIVVGIGLPRVRTET